jgi:hypothetical protein
MNAVHNSNGSRGNDGINKNGDIPCCTPYDIIVGSIISGRKRNSIFVYLLFFFMPGENITNIYVDEENFYQDGTSFAAALLTGVIASMKEQHPKIHQPQVIHNLREMTDKKVRDRFCGYGIPIFQ